MGRPAFTRFLVPRAGTAGRGVRWAGESATWDALLDRGRRRAALVRPQRAYQVDPAAGLESLVSLLAVATVPDTVLLWASGVPGRRDLAPGLAEVDPPVPGPLDRPLWGVATSGSTGSAKLALGHADAWESIALHYERALYADCSPGGMPPVLATCLPLQFSASFFMTVLPSLLLRRDLVVFPPHDWSAVHDAATSREVAVLGVPALAAAACLAMTRPVDARRVALFLGGGHLGAERVRLIRERFEGASVRNVYGTAETGAVAVDPAPGHNQHVGHPVVGKAVWLEGTDERGIGTVAVAGPDCCLAIWRPGQDARCNEGYVAATDHGRFDDQGRLCLEGRVDGGEKLHGMLVYPRAIERHLLTLPGVADARVLVRRTETGLEHLTARVVGRVGADEVRAHCASLAEAERPSRVECVPESTALAAYSANGKL